MKSLTITLLCVVNSLHCMAQGECDQGKLRKQVLAENKVDRPFVFTCGKDERVELVYLGVVGSKLKGYKVIRSFWVHGESHRGTSRILIFDERNRLLGNYYVAMDEELPDRIESRELVFLNLTSPDCDKTVVSRVSFEKGIPEKIFVRCEGDTGYFYAFSRAE
jgi:hypothetical protein